VTAEHRHAWRIVDFLVSDNRPMLAQACACGATRVMRAWDRSWDPADDRGRSAKPRPID